MGPLRLFVVIPLCLSVGQAENNPNLQVSPAALAFTAVMEGAPPTPQAIGLVTLDGAPVEFALRLDGGGPAVPAPDWMLVAPRRAATPARILVRVDAAGLPAGEAPPARILVTDPTGIAISDPIPVSLQVISAAPGLTVEPGLVRFFGRKDGPQTLETPLYVGNSGAGPPPQLSVSAASETSWLRAEVESCASDCLVLVTAFIRDLEPGGYHGVVTIASDIGTREAPVSLFVAGYGPALKIGPGGFQFEVRPGQTQTAGREIRVVNAAGGTLGWQAEIIGGGAWLSLNPVSGTAQPGNPGTTQLTVNPAGLPVGARHGLLRFSSPEYPDSPQYAPVLLRVAEEMSLAPTFSHNGLLFKAASGDTSPNSHAVTMFAGSATPVWFQSAPLVSESVSTSWLTVAPTRNLVSREAPAELFIGATAGGLPAGIYTGKVNVSVDAGTIRAVNATFVVSPPATSICTPQWLAAVHTALPGNFLTRVGAPTPVVVEVSDSCGSPVTEAAVMVTFSTGDPSITLQHAGGGVYTGTWAPIAPSTSLPQGLMSVTARVWAAGLHPVEAQLTGTVAADSATLLAANSVLHNTYPRVGAPLAPGTAVQLYGLDLAPGELAPPIENGRLPTGALGASVIVGPWEAPLYYVGPHQITAQLPVELSPFRQYQVLVAANGAYTVAETINVNAVTPGIAAYIDGRVIAQDAAYHLIDGNNPARPGEYVIIYLVGMGPTDPVVGTGETTNPPLPYTVVLTPPEITLGGRPVETVYFAGMTPGYVGLYQIIFQAPPDAPAGDLKLVVSQDGALSNETILPVR